MQSELKPCPFCGSAGMFENARGSYGYYPEKLRVRCSDEGCHGQTGWFNHGERDYDETRVAKSKAITAWNIRASDAEIARLTEALRLQMEAKHKEAEEARLWFSKAQEWREALHAAEENINLKADFIDATINQLAAKDQDIYELKEALRAAEEQVKGLREALEEISDLPGEINPCNYDHDDACELNRQFCYGLLIARAAMKGPSHDLA